MNGKRKNEFLPKHLTLAKAREIIGEDAEQYSDEELKQMISSMFALAKAYLDAVHKS